VLCVAGQVKRLVVPTAQQHEQHVLVHKVADWLPAQVQEEALEEEFVELEDDDTEPVVKVLLLKNIRVLCIKSACVCVEACGTVLSFDSIVHRQLLAASVYR
jgi:hypothetical protein